VRHGLTFGFISVLGLVAWVLFASLDTVPYAPTSDDGYYLHFMQVVARDGLSAFPGLFAAWNANPSDWLYPPPLRVGFILASAGWAKLFGASLHSLSWLSLVSHLAWTSVNWLFARRRMGEGFALLLATFCGFSPLLLGLGRLALMDSFSCLWVTLALWLFLEMIEQPLLRSWRILFGVVFAFAILTKEISVLIALPMAASVLLERYVRKTPLPLGRFAAVLAVPALLTLPIFVVAAGGFEPLVTTAYKVLTSPKTNRYALEYCAGPWYRYLIDYLCLSPFPTLLGLLASGALVDRVRGGAWPRPQIFFAVVGAGLLTEQAFLIKNVRYMVALELPLRLLALSWLLRIAAGLSPWLTWGLVGSVVGVLCLLDWQTFRLWVEAEGYDPVSSLLLQLRDIVP
jgi:hypothetical protein